MMASTLPRWLVASLCLCFAPTLLQAQQDINTDRHTDRHTRSAPSAVQGALTSAVSDADILVGESKSIRVSLAKYVAPECPISLWSCHAHSDPGLPSGLAMQLPNHPVPPVRFFFCFFVVCASSNGCCVSACHVRCGVLPTTRAVRLRTSPPRG